MVYCFLFFVLFFFVLETPKGSSQQHRDVMFDGLWTPYFKVPTTAMLMIHLAQRFSFLGSPAELFCILG